MNDQEINEVIAKILGLQYHKPTKKEIKTGSYYQFEPRYTTDLNSIQAAVINKICGEQALEKRFLNEMHAIIDGYADSEDVPCVCETEMTLLSAEAWVWAHALLKTFGKWKD